MSDNADQSDLGKSRGRPERDSRRDRLKLALRENLKRRKAQARGRHDVSGADTVGSDDPDRREP